MIIDFSEEERKRLESRLESIQIDSKFRDKLLNEEETARKKVS